MSNGPQKPPPKPPPAAPKLTSDPETRKPPVVPSKGPSAAGSPPVSPPSAQASLAKEPTRPQTAAKTPAALQREPNTVAAVRPAPATPSSAAPGLEPGELAELDRLAVNMQQMDYFEILRVPQTASPAEIKAAFYRWSRTYHPDRFYHLPDGILKEHVHEVYKRITEAYYFLRNDTHRKKYLVDLSGPDRALKLRFTEVSEVEAKAAKKKEHEEQIGVHPKGRQFFQTGMGDFEAGRWSAAARSFKMALTYEPQNPRYKEKLAESQQKEYEETRAKGAHFKIT